MTSPELGLRLPLGGVQLIEASAGTGKTHTLATLYARLVISARLEVGQILAVTYTRAATAELRERLRAPAARCAVPDRTRFRHPCKRRSDRRAAARRADE